MNQTHPLFKRTEKNRLKEFRLSDDVRPRAKIEPPGRHYGFCRQLEALTLVIEAWSCEPVVST